MEGRTLDACDWKGTVGKAQLERKQYPDYGEIVIDVPYEGAYGMGERFNGLNQKGKTVENQIVEKFCYQDECTYLTIPFFVTDSGFGLYIETQEKTTFHFKEAITCQFPADAKIYTFAGEPKEIIKAFMELSGKVKLPPKFAFGIWASANHWNNEKAVEDLLKALEQYEFPASVVVLEAWSDEANFYIWNGAEYTPKAGGEAFTYDEFDFSKSNYWSNPKEMIENLHEKGIKLVLWQIPVYKEQEIDAVVNEQLVLDKKDALDRKLCVFREDGTPYKIPEGNWFEGSFIPDFTRKETKETWFKKRKYLLDMGVDGFKTDGGEFIYTEDVVFADGMNGRQAKNRYAQDYVSAYNQFIDEEDVSHEKVLFSRAGFTGAHTTPIHWGGDQQSTNAELNNVLQAGLSAAMSGIVFWGFDIAGFAGKLPTPDLYLRATQLAVFTPVMQWHSEPDGGQFKELMPGESRNNERSPWNMAQVVSGQESEKEEFLKEVRYWHYLRMNLLPYIYSTACDCAENTEVMMRPLVYDFPDDREAVCCEDEYCFGKSLLIAPLLEENSKTRMVYLPEGEWYGLFSGIHYQGKSHINSAEAELFPVYLRSGEGIAVAVANETATTNQTATTNKSAATDAAETAIKKLGKEFIGNNMNEPTDIHFILAGEKGKYRYRDNIREITVVWENEEVHISESAKLNITWEVVR